MVLQVKARRSEIGGVVARRRAAPAYARSVRAHVVPAEARGSPRACGLMLYAAACAARVTSAMVMRALPPMRTPTDRNESSVRVAHASAAWRRRVVEGVWCGGAARAGP